MLRFVIFDVSMFSNNLITLSVVIPVLYNVRFFRFDFDPSGDFIMTRIDSMLSFEIKEFCDNPKASIFPLKLIFSNNLNALCSR